jgi:hypothetical protein
MVWPPSFLAYLALVALMLPAACERADGPAPPPPPPVPLKHDPIEQARSEFEVLPAEYASGAWIQYARGEFVQDTSPEAQFDEGDFIGRLRTLFGTSEDNEYVLRHRATGFIITAYSGKSGPSFTCGARYQGTLPPGERDAWIHARPQHDDPAIAARKAADPVLASEGQPTDLDELQTKARHLADAEAGPELAMIVVHLNALLDAVPPADWERTFFYDEGPSVERVGAKGGHSFSLEVPPAEAFTFVLAAAESQDRNERDALGGIPVDADAAVVMYYLEHQDDLRDQRPRALAAYQRVVVDANSYSGDVRRATLDMARDYAGKLGVKPPR